jgi:putative lipoprotein (rSAM/lipoprotein system)
MLSFVKKSLLWIVSGTASVLLTACYGVMSMADCFNKKITVIDSAGNPIEGLEITFSDNDGNIDVAYSDKDGKAEMFFCTYDDKVNVKVVDIDGEENGEFKEQELVVSSRDNSEEIVMESVE